MEYDEDCQCEIDKTKKPKDILKSSIYDKKVEVVPKTKAQKAREAKEKAAKEAKDAKVRAPVSQCGDLRPVKLDDLEVDRVLIEYRQRPIRTSEVGEENRLPLCDAFKMAGFQADWTKKKIENMLKSDDGKMILKKVDSEFKRITGKPKITEKDILQCYPNYFELRPFT